MTTLLHIAQSPPASTWGTYHAGYTLVALIYIGYTLSLWVRGRRYRRVIDDGSSSRG
jgi:hypothetical protein